MRACVRTCVRECVCVWTGGVGWGEVARAGSISEGQAGQPCRYDLHLSFLVSLNILLSIMRSAPGCICEPQ